MEYGKFLLSTLGSSIYILLPLWESVNQENFLVFSMLAGGCPRCGARFGFSASLTWICTPNIRRYKMVFMSLLFGTPHVWREQMIQRRLHSSSMYCNRSAFELLCKRIHNIDSRLQIVLDRCAGNTLSDQEDPAQTTSSIQWPGIFFVPLWSLLCVCS